MMNKKNILLVSLSHLACDVNGGTLPALLPFLISDYGFSYSAAASLMLAYSSLSSIIQPLFGFLSDRISKPWFIPAGILLAGLGMSSVGFLQSYWAIFAAVALSGTGAALFHPEGARFASKVSGSAQGTGLSIFPSAEIPDMCSDRCWPWRSCMPLACAAHRFWRLLPRAWRP